MHDDEERHARGDRLRNVATALIGVAGLIAWIAMLWFMFGDVL